MKKVMIGSALIGMLALPAFSQAAQSSNTATLTVTGEVVGTLTLTVDGAGAGTFTLPGVAAQTDVGAMSKYGAAPTNGFVRTVNGTTSWTLSSNIGVRVEKANLTSDTYILNARLTTAPPAGVVWALGTSSPLTAAATATPVTSTGVYGGSQPYAWSITIADSELAATVNNTVEFTAVSN